MAIGWPPPATAGLPDGHRSVSEDWCRVEASSSAFDTSGGDGLSWLDSVRVGYDKGFVIASQRDLDLETSDFPFRMQINGWGQLRYTVSDVAPPNTDLNQFQLQRGRIVFTGHAFNSDVSYFVQLDGRSSSGDNIRLLDYYLSYDIGHDQFGLDEGHAWVPHRKVQDAFHHGSLAFRETV